MMRSINLMLWILLLWLFVVNYQLCLSPLLLMMNCVEAQTNVTTLSEARAYLTATSLDGLVFFGGGATSPTSASERVDIYNVTNGNWMTSSLSIPRAYLAATSSGNLVFFGGGSNSINVIGTTVYDRIDIYNVSNGNWSTNALSIARCCLAATSVGDLVIFGGGFDNSSNPSAVVDMYNVTWNMWWTTTVTNLSVARGCLASTTVAERWVLFGGGASSGSQYSNVVDIYDSINGTWWTSTLSQARGNLAAASFGNLAFFGGGNTTGSAQLSGVVDIFDLTTQTWNTTTLSQNRTGLAASSIGNIVAFGGGYMGSLMTAIVDVYDGTRNIWFTITLSAPRSFLASTSSTNKIFFGGGDGYTSYAPTVDIFDINTLQSPSSLQIPSFSTGTTSPSNLPIAIVSVLSSSQPLSSNGLPAGAIVGIVVGGVLMLIGLGVIVFIVKLKKKRKDVRETYSPLSFLRKDGGTNDDNKNITTLLARSGDTVIRSQISFNELVIEKEIAEGSYGKICLGRWNDAPVALKFCRKKASVEDFVSEIKIMVELPPHPNVVQLYGVSLDGPQPVIIMEYCAGGSLDDLLFDRLDQTITNAKKIELVQGIARGVSHLHKHNIVHRDLAARNILLGGNGEPKITDFGMSRILEKADEGKTKSGVGPVCWMAPESLETMTYSKKSDVWTFGIVVYEIVARREPHADRDVLEAALAIRDKGLTPNIPDDCPPLLRQVMELCWQKDPEQRPTMEAILGMLSASRNPGTV